MAMRNLSTPLASTFGDEKKATTKKNKAGTTQIDPKTRKTSLTGKDYTNQDYSSSNEALKRGKSAAKRYGKQTTVCNFNKSKTKKSCTTYNKNGKVISRKIVDVKKG